MIFTIKVGTMEEKGEESRHSILCGGCILFDATKFQVNAFLSHPRVNMREGGGW